MTDKLNKRGRKKTKDRVSTAIMIDRDLYEWTVGRNRSDIVNDLLRKYKKEFTEAYSEVFTPSQDVVNNFMAQVIKAEDEEILIGKFKKQTHE